MVYRRNDVVWENSRHYATPPPREMTCEKQKQKFHTVDASLPRSGSCFWLLEGNFQPITSTTEILKVTRHQYGIFAQVSRSDVISCRNLWWHRPRQMARFVFLWSVSLMQRHHPAKWRVRNKNRNSILLTRHFPDLGRASDCSKEIFSQSQAQPRS